MKTNHARFQLFCALAELGQLSSLETMEFREHCQTCAICRQRLLELAHLHATIVVTNKFINPLHQAPREMTRRFIARANREGVPLNQRASTAYRANLILASAAFIGLLLAGTIVGRTHPAPSPVPASIALQNAASSLDAATGPASLDNWLRTASIATRRVEPRQRRSDSPLGRHNSTTQSSDHPSRLITNNKLVDADSLLSKLNFVPDSDLNRSSKFPRFKFSLPPETSNRETTMLAACACSPLTPLSFPTSTQLGASTQFFRPDGSGYPTALKAEFRPDPGKFQLIEEVRQ